MSTAHNQQHLQAESLSSIKQLNKKALGWQFRLAKHVPAGCQQLQAVDDVPVE
jgi:hypothetical protein